MPNDPTPPFAGGFQEPGVFCRRLKQLFEPAEHEACAYCHGERAEIATGDHTKFCSYDPQRDPVHFGFPDDTERERHG